MSHKVHLQRFLLDSSLAIGEAGSCTVKVTNTGAAPFPGGVLRIHADSYFAERIVALPAIAVGGEATVRLPLVPGGGKTVWDIPQTNRLTVEVAPCTVVAQSEVRSLLSEFVGTLQRAVPRHLAQGVTHFNVALVGVAGRGKTTFLAKVDTLLTSRDYQAKAPAPGVSIPDALGHCTVRLQKTALPGSRLALWDTYGYDYGNYRDNLLAYLMEGRLPGRWDMSAPVTEAMVAQLAAGAATRHERRIHSVVLFIGKQEALTDLPEQVTALQSFVRDFASFNPIVVVGMADTIAGQDWRQERTGQYWKDFRATVARVTGVRPVDVFLNANSVDTSERTLEHDRQTFAILQEALGRAVQFEARYGARGAVPPHEMSTEEQPLEW